MREVGGCTLAELIEANQVRFTKKQKIYLKFKRIADVILSFLALILLSPVFVIVAVMIKLDSPKENVLFKQQRVGLDGKLFWIYKFRSMKCGTPELGTSEFLDAEQYITKVGKFIRRTSLDELPQLFCCLCGTMSVVGPRPLLEREEEMHFLRYYYGIYQVRPGITGLAQVNGRDAMGNCDKVYWDRTYVRHISLKQDVQILWQTVVKVIKHDGVMDDSGHKRGLEQATAYWENQGE